MATLQRAAEVASVVGASAASVRTEEDREEASTENREINFGGPRVKLYMRQCIADMHLSWEREDDLEDKLDEGFAFVSPKELPRAPEFGIVKNADVADKVVKDGGRGVRLYLMKLPTTRWDKRQEILGREAASREAEIFGNYTEDDSDFYQPGGVKTKRSFIQSKG